MFDKVNDLYEKKLKILFTAGGSPVHEALYKQLNNKYDLFFADVDLVKISPSIPDNKKIKLPYPNDKKYIAEVSFFIKKYKINVLVPGIDEELVLLQKNCKLFHPCKVFLPKSDFVYNMLDKFKMNKKLIQKKINVPRTIQADKKYDTLKFPVILKPKKGRGSRNIFTFHSDKNLKFFLLSLGENIKNWIIQEKLIGVEYTVQVFSTRKSDIICILPVRVVEKRGSTISAFTENNLNVIRYCKSIHDNLKPSGCYNIQLIEMFNGEIGAFEINPRISTTFCLGIESGFDPFSFEFGVNKKINKNKNFRKINLERHYVNFFR